MHFHQLFRFCQNAPYLGRENWNWLGEKETLRWKVELLWCQRKFPLLFLFTFRLYAWSSPGEQRCVGPLCGCCCLPSKKLYLIMVCVGTPVSFRDYISGLPPEKVTVGNRRLPQISVLFAAKPGGYIMCKRVRSARIKSVSFPWKAWLSLWHWLCHPKKLTVTRLFKAGCWGMFLVF